MARACSGAYALTTWLRVLLPLASRVESMHTRCMRPLRLLLLLVPLLSGCLATGLSDVDAEEGFDWSTLMRDQLLMTPLVDLRPQPASPFFDDAERAAYPERFKLTFQKMRKDIRVFGAGGAFENMAKLPNLTQLAAQALAKQPFSDADVEKIKAGSQDIRFTFFFAVTEERIGYDFRYEFRADQELDRKIYVTSRLMTVRLALWDSKVNRTVWIGTEHLSPSESNVVEVRNPTKRKTKKNDRIIWVGQPERTSLDAERRRSPERFPGAPSREPAFSASFDDFALALPLHPSEAKLIEYTHFTYHRPELLMRTSHFAEQTTVGMQLGFSSVINYRLRFGGALLFPLAANDVKFQGEDLAIAMAAFGATFDYEWELGKELRLLTGLMAGGATFSLTPAEPDATDPTTDGTVKTETDGALFVWPRVYLLFGDKGGFQWGAGAAARFYDGVDEAAIKAHRPAPWSLDLGISYAFRGF